MITVPWKHNVLKPMARRAQTVIQRKREELISLSTIHLLSPGKGGGKGVGKDFGDHMVFSRKESVVRI